MPKPRKEMTETEARIDHLNYCIKSHTEFIKWDKELLDELDKVIPFVKTHKCSKVLLILMELRSKKANSITYLDKEIDKCKADIQALSTI